MNKLLVIQTIGYTNNMNESYVEGKGARKPFGIMDMYIVYCADGFMSVHMAFKSDRCECECQLCSYKM